MVHTPDPFTEVRDARQQRAELTERIKQLDRQCVEHGFAAGWNAAQIAAAIGSAQSHVYAVRNAMKRQ